MKDKILILIIGILIGAVITTAGFLIYNKTKSNNTQQPEMMQMDGNNPMNGEKPDGDSGEEPPTKPDGDNEEEPPAKPEDLDNNTNS